MLDKGGQAMKSQMFLSGMDGTWKMMKEVVIQDLTQLMKMLKNCGIWCI
jgi:hypothetical protein